MAAILEPAYREYFRRPLAYGRFYGRFETYAEALAAVPKTMPSSYDTVESAGMYRERLDRVHVEDYPVLFWIGQGLAAAQAKGPAGRTPRVFDLI